MVNICNASDRRETALLESLAVSDFSILASCRSDIPTCLANLGRPILVQLELILIALSLFEVLPSLCFLEV